MTLPQATILGVQLQRALEHLHRASGLAPLHEHLGEPTVGVFVLRTDLGSPQERRLRLGKISLLEPNPPLEHQQRGIFSALREADLHDFQGFGVSLGLEQRRSERNGVFIAPGAEAEQADIEVVCRHVVARFGSLPILPKLGALRIFVKRSASRTPRESVRVPGGGGLRQKLASRNKQRGPASADPALTGYLSSDVHRLGEEVPISAEDDYTPTAMVVIACSGFPVPVSRYFREFEAVEISETELGIPGAGTVRRWLREAPEGFLFTLLAPKEIAASGFAQTPANEKLVKEVGALCKTMKAVGVVFAAPPEFGPTRPNKTSVKKFVESLPARYPKAVLSLAGWKVSDVSPLVESKKNVVAAYDPLEDTPPPARSDLVYLRLPGPAGYRSRYDEGALVKTADHVNKLKAKTIICTFHNIDMHANATRARELIGQK